MPKAANQKLAARTLAFPGPVRQFWGRSVLAESGPIVATGQANKWVEEREVNVCTLTHDKRVTKTKPMGQKKAFLRTTA